MLPLGQGWTFLLYGSGETVSSPKEGTEQPTPALALALSSAAPSLGVDGSQWLEPPLAEPGLPPPGVERTGML